MATSNVSVSFSWASRTVRILINECKVLADDRTEKNELRYLVAAG